MTIDSMPSSSSSSSPSSSTTSTNHNHSNKSNNNNKYSMNTADKVIDKIWEKHYSTLVFVCFCLLGFCNSFPFIIMLSAAHDFMKNEEGVSRFGAKANNRYDCNDLSTGVVLLADILPGISIKLLIPFIAHRLHYWQRVMMVVCASSACFLIVSFSPNETKWLILLGVIFGSASSSLGEMTFLSLSTLYPPQLSFAGWAGGTGASGLFATLIFAGLTSLGLSPSQTILMMIFVPVLMSVSYVMLPTHRPASTPLSLALASQASSSILVSVGTPTSVEENNKMHNVNGGIILPSEVVSGKDKLEKNKSPFSKMTWREKLRLMRPLLKYMLPLFFVYFCEYLINQGFFELLYFKSSFIANHSLQYRWYNVIFRFGVFVARMSIRFVQIKYLFVFVALQLLNVMILLSQILVGWMPAIWVVFLVIFWEGLLGGGCYVNAFHLLSTEISSDTKEFSIAITTLADSLGIALAGFTAIPVHNAICRYGRME